MTITVAELKDLIIERLCEAGELVTLAKEQGIPCVGLDNGSIAIQPEALVGHAVTVPEPDMSDDAWDHGFVGSVIAVKNQHLLQVRDQDGDVFDVEWWRVETAQGAARA